MNIKQSKFENILMTLKKRDFKTLHIYIKNEVYDTCLHLSK